MNVYQRVSYMKLILRGSVLKKYKAVLLEFKKSSKGIAGDKCTLGDMKGLSTDNFWTWDNIDGISYDVDAYLGLYKCVDFKK